MSREEADGYLERVRGGEHSGELRARVTETPLGPQVEIDAEPGSRTTSVDLALTLDLRTDLSHFAFVRRDVGVEPVPLGGRFLF
jgi:hypothetical protein